MESRSHILPYHQLCCLSWKMREKFRIPGTKNFYSWPQRQRLSQAIWAQESQTPSVPPPPYSTVQCYPKSSGNSPNLSTIIEFCLPFA